MTETNVNAQVEVIEPEVKTEKGDTNAVQGADKPIIDHIIIKDNDGNDICELDLNSMTVKLAEGKDIEEAFKSFWTGVVKTHSTVLQYMYWNTVAARSLAIGMLNHRELPEQLRSSLTMVIKSLDNSMSVFYINDMENIVRIENAINEMKAKAKANQVVTEDE